MTKEESILNIPFEIITDWLGDTLTLDEKQRQRLQKYAELLCLWNEKMNLTAITDPEGIAVKHFLDSMTVFKFAEIKQNSRVIDVGTGAGFPGLVMKIVRPDLEITLLDSLAKRIGFLDEVIKTLGLDGISTVHSRAEDGAAKYRESFDIAVARAVAAMPVLCEYCLPYVKVGGRFIAMKGQSVLAEAEGAESAVRILGGKMQPPAVFSLYDAGTRGIITVEKISQTPLKYPRNPAKISKSPL